MDADATSSPTPPPPRPAPRRGRLFFGVFLLAVFGTLGIMEWRGWPWLKEPATQYLSEKLHHPVRVTGGFALHLLGKVQLNLGVLEVGPPSWQAQGKNAQKEPLALLRAERVRLVLPYYGLWQAAWRRDVANVRVKEISLDRLDANLSRDRSGRANWSLEEPGQTAPNQSQATKLPRIDKLQVRQGQVSVDDAVLGLNLLAHITTTEGEAGGEGLRVTGDGHYKGNPFEMHVSASGALPLLTEPLKSPPVPISIKAEAGRAQMQFEGTTRDLLKLGQLEGQLRLKGASLSAVGDAVAVTLPTTAPFSLVGQLKKDGDVWGLKMQTLKVGDSHLDGDFTLDRRRQPPLLQGRLSGTHLALVDLAPAFGAPTNGAPNPKPPNGRVLPQKTFDVPSLRAMDARVQLRIKRASLGSWFAQPFQPLEADLQLQSGVLQLSNVLARTAGGSVAGSVRLDGNGPQLQWDTKLKWAGIRLESWLKAPDKRLKDMPAQAKTVAQATPAAAPPAAQIASQPAAHSSAPPAPPSYVSGQLAGKATLHGQGNSTAKLLASLDGQVATWVSDGQVSRLLAEAVSLHVAEVLGLWVTGDTRQPMQCAVAQLRASKGTLTPDVAVVDTPDVTVLVSGQVSLAQERLNLTLTTYPKSLSPLSLRTPLDVDGTFADPSVSLHPYPLGVKVLAAIALSTVSPLASVIPLVDVGQPKAAGCQQTLQGLKPQVKPPAKAP